MSENTIFFLVGQLIIAGGVYAAIRADLREHSVRIKALEDRCTQRKQTD